MVDIFDTILEKKKNSDIFAQVLKKKTDIFAQVSEQIPKVFRSYIKAYKLEQKPPSDAWIIALINRELSKIKPTTIERTMALSNAIEKPGKTTETIIKEVFKEDKRPDELKKEIELLKEELTRVKETLPMLGGSGVIGIPPPEGNESKVLTVKSNKASWQTAAAGGSSTDVYTPTNVTTTQSFNATLTSLDELANILGSLIVSLQGAGIIK